MGADLQLNLVLVLYLAIARTHGDWLEPFVGVFPQYDTDCETLIPVNTSGSVLQLEEALDDLTSETRLVLQSVVLTWSPTTTHSLAQPFQLKIQNSFESFFLANLLLLIVGSVFFSQERQSVSDPYVYVVVVFAYMIMIIIACIHIFIRFPQLKQRLVDFLCYCCHRYSRHKHQKVAEVKDVTDSTVVLTVLAKPQVTYAELREPLLEAGSLEINPVVPESVQS